MFEKNQKYLLAFAIILAIVLLVLVALLPLRNQASAPANPTRAIPRTGPGTAATFTPFRTGTQTPKPETQATQTLPATQPLAITATPAVAQVLPTSVPQAQREFFVAVDGSEGNDGSQAQPWPLQYALDQPEALQPGDTVWLRGGQYTGSFTCRLQGAEGKPITIRAYLDERAILANEDLVLDIARSSYVNLWGLEITATHNSRDPETRPASGYGVRINQGEESHHIKFINMIVHDLPAQGFGWWQANTDSEIYGTLVYFNGVTQLDHGIYTHNNTGEKRLVDNIIFDNASHGIHAYGEKDYQGLNNLHIEGNTIFDNGSIGYSTTLKSYGIYKRNILVGGDSLVAENPVITDNYTYYPSGNGEALNLGYRTGSKNAVVENNYFAGGRVALGGENLDIQMLKNTILGFGVNSFSQLSIVGNDYLLTKPRTVLIFVRPNRYEAGRANITIYNWRKQDHITLTANDLKAVQIQSGDVYELRNVQDYFSDILTGSYDGQQIDVPMINHSVAQPLGLDFKPSSTFPEFGAFVLSVRTKR